MPAPASYLSQTQSAPNQTGLPTLKARALALLARREYSRLELERKLAPWSQQPGDVAALLDDLQSRNFISQQRVIESVLNRCLAKYGALRIKQVLQQKGIAGDTLAQILAQLRPDEFERARALLCRRFGAPAASLAERAKQGRFLLGRGFAPAVVAQVLRLTDGSCAD